MIDIAPSPPVGAQIDPDRPEAAMVRLPTGEPLTPKEAEQITRSAPTRVVVFIGAVDAGKTTLLTSPYERFQVGPFGGYDFAGSLTMVGFEKICHPSRLSSERRRAETRRTPLGPHYCLHLRVSREGSESSLQDILLVNISGEECDSANDSADDCRRMEILRRADHVVLVLDGGKLATLDERQRARNYGINLLRSLLEAGMIGRRTIVDVVVNKWDLVERQGAAQNGAVPFIEVVKQEIKSRFSAVFGKLESFEVAARPEEGQHPPAFNVEPLFRSWVEGSCFTTPGGRNRKPGAAVTEFDAFAERLRLIVGEHT